MRKKFLILLMGAALAFTGCGRAEKSIAKITKISYEKKEYQTVTAQKMDIVPTLKLSLVQEGAKYVNYGTSDVTLVFDKLYVKVGDKVKAGDLLVSFKSENLDEKVEELKRIIEEDKLLVEHYKKLNSIEKNGSYDRDILLLERNIIVNNLYLEECNEKIDKCQIRAEEDGTVSFVAESAENGFISEKMLTVFTGTGKYVTTTKDEYKLEIGEIYMAECDGLEYSFTLESEVYDEETQNRRLFFVPTSNISVPEDRAQLTMTIEKDPIKDAVYVPSKCVAGNSYGYYVYVEKENGFFDKVDVKIGEKINDYTIILEGLNGGEKVRR